MRQVREISALICLAARRRRACRAAAPAIPNVDADQAADTDYFEDIDAAIEVL